MATPFLFYNHLAGTTYTPIYPEVGEYVYVPYYTNQVLKIFAFGFQIPSNAVITAVDYQTYIKVEPNGAVFELQTPNTNSPSTVVSGSSTDWTYLSYKPPVSLSNMPTPAQINMQDYGPIITNLDSNITLFSIYAYSITITYNA